MKRRKGFVSRHNALKAGLVFSMISLLVAVTAASTSASQLANFATHQLYLSIGQSSDIKVQARNAQADFDNITITLTGYTMAYFMNTTEGRLEDVGGMENRKLIAGLNPYEENTFYVRVISSDVQDKPYSLNLTATSEINPALTDEDAVYITIRYPPSFPGLAGWAVAVLIMLSAAAYWGIGLRKPKK